MEDPLYEEIKYFLRLVTSLDLDYLFFGEIDHVVVDVMVSFEPKGLWDFLKQVFVVDCWYFVQVKVSWPLLRLYLAAPDALLNGSFCETKISPWKILGLCLLRVNG